MTDLSLVRAGRLLRTARHVRPAQVGHRARLRAEKALFGRIPVPVLERAFSRVHRPRGGGWPGWPPGFAPLDAEVVAEGGSAEDFANRVFGFLGDTRSLGDPPEWEPRDVPQLWRFHLHYFEWGWAFVDHPDRQWASGMFRRLWRSWCSGTRVGRWDAWSPYAASVRAWALCGFFAPLVAGTDDEVAFVESLAVHAGFARANLELDVAGNHVVKNLKALAGLGVFLGDESLVRSACRHLNRQLRVQVLADGGHFERSPSYHAQVLGDLLDIAGLLTAAGRATAVAGLHDVIAAMRDWLGAMLLPDGDVPLFNDCVLVGRERLRALGVRPARLDALTVLAPSGYVIARPDDRLHLVLDAAPPCPPDLPAHAHADTLSFELAVDGERVVVDTGTSTYQDAERRRVERSTAAHNTVEVDATDSTEVWGAFRAARRANAVLEMASGDDGAIEIVARHDGYRRLPGKPIHRRRFRMRAGSIDVHDEITGGGDHCIAARVHVAPGSDCQIISSNEAVLGPLRVRTRGGDLSVVEAVVARQFGDLRATRCLVLEASGRLPTRLETTFELREPS